MKKQILYLIFTVLSLMSIPVLAQNVSINNSGALPDSSAMLDVSDTASGFLMPRMSAAQRMAITSPADHLMVIQTDGSKGLYMYDLATTSWLHLLDSVAVAAMIQSLGAPSLDSVLVAGNDAAGDSILNLGALNIGGGANLAQVQLDSMAVVDAAGYQDAYGWFGLNLYKLTDTTLAYIKDGSSSVLAAGDDFTGLFRWPVGTSGTVLAGDAISYIRMQDGEIAMANAGERYEFGDHFVLDTGRIRVLGSGNSVLIGDSAGLNDDFTNNQNVAVGQGALSASVTGNKNVAVGRNAGRSTTGGGNIFLGHAAGANETGSEKLYIDNNSTATPLIYGDFSDDSVRIHGVLQVDATTNGDAELVLRSDQDNNNENDNPILTFEQDGGGNKAQIRLHGTSNSYIANTPGNSLLMGTLNGEDITFFTDSIARMTIEAGGDIGIGTTEPAYNLHLVDTGGNGSVHIRTTKAGHDAYIEFRNLESEFDIINHGSDGRFSIETDTDGGHEVHSAHL